jgi:hypothetical protein
MKEIGEISKIDINAVCHCEERSDEAIFFIVIVEKYV